MTILCPLFAIFEGEDDRCDDESNACDGIVYRAKTRAADAVLRVIPGSLAGTFYGRPFRIGILMHVRSFG
jgi:hypothetical protein